MKQYERGVVFRLGRLRPEVRGPGFTMVVPFVDSLRKVNMQIVTMPVPAQEGITRDNVTVRVDAVVYFQVASPADAVVRVEDYRFAVSQMADTPAALQLRLLQTVVAVAAEKNSTLVLPFPVELLRFLEKAQQLPPAAGGSSSGQS